MVFDAVLPAVGAAASAIILAMIAGSSFRTMLAALSLQILLTAGQLASIKAAVGMPLLNPDEILLVWSAFLWMIALADGRASARRSGALGALIVVFSAIVAVSATRGQPQAIPWPARSRWRRRCSCISSISPRCGCWATTEGSKYSGRCCWSVR